MITKDKEGLASTMHNIKCKSQAIFMQYLASSHDKVRIVPTTGTWLANSQSLPRMTVTPLYRPPSPIHYSYLHTSPFLLHWSQWSVKWSSSHRGGPVQSATSWHTVPSTPTGCPHPTHMSWRRLAFRSYSGLRTVEHGNKGALSKRHICQVWQSTAS